MKRITVYGSLLEGMSNWKWHLDNEESTKLGEHTLDGGFSMMSFGGFPGLLLDPNATDKIFVETYEVSDRVYASIERLEGYPSFYDKHAVETPYGPSEVYFIPRASGRQNMVLPGEDGVINWRKYRGK